jgi:cell division protein FtsW (lipid II flippase)
MLGCPLGDPSLGSSLVVVLLLVLLLVAFLPFSNKNKRKWKNIAWINIQSIEKNKLLSNNIIICTSLSAGRLHVWLPTFRCRFSGCPFL